MSQHGLQTSSASHLEALISKHHALESKIHKEEKRPLPSDTVLRNLKLKKLHIKEELERIKQAS